MSAGWTAAAVVLFIAAGLMVLAALGMCIEADFSNRKGNLPRLAALTAGLALPIALLGAVCIGIAS